MVVDGLCKVGHMDKALDLCIFAKMKGITLSIITYNSVINGLCQQGCFIDAFRLFDSLAKNDMVPLKIKYATLIDTLCKEGNLVDARKLFERMVVKGFEICKLEIGNLLNYTKSMFLTLIMCGHHRITSMFIYFELSGINLIS